MSHITSKYHYPQFRPQTENQKRLSTKSDKSPLSSIGTKPVDLYYSDQASETYSTPTSTPKYCFLESKPPGKNQNSGGFNAYSKLKQWCRRSIPFMASEHTEQTNLPVDHNPAPMEEKKTQNAKERRKELEEEVSTLQQKLDHEQQVHEILELVRDRQDGSPIWIPKFLPPKTKEILAELAMVDDEIARLETQIAQLQNNLEEEEKATKELKSEQRQHGTTMYDPLTSPTLSPLPNPTTMKQIIREKMPFEAETIKGDYDLRDLSMNEPLRSWMDSVSDQKENHFDEKIGIQERVPQRMEKLKRASPLRIPRHPTPGREPNLDIPLDLLPPKDLSSSPAQSKEESIHNLLPNQLSESIMRCLIFIFVRLLRTSRTMGLEKSSFPSSFRPDTSLNSKASSLMSQRESRQQHPYGVFDTEHSIPRDIRPYKNLVRFTSSSFDPKCISSSNPITLLQKLSGLINNLRKVDLRFLSYQQKLAFWINMYNACIMHGFLQYGVPSSPEKHLKLMKKARLNIGGIPINAQAIEHYILRKPPSSLDIPKVSREEKTNELIIYQRYGLESVDPNVIFALCCGTHSSPAVKIYTSDGVEAELEKSKLEYLQASVVVTNARTIALPELLLGNMRDFARDVDSLVEWVCYQLPTSGSLRKAMLECFRGLSRNDKVSTIVEKIPYNFEFQYLLEV